jgi:hypothetical protein
MRTALYFLAYTLWVLAVLAQGTGVTPPCPTGKKAIKLLKNCPSGGCGDASDAFLNLAKNRTDIPSPGQIQIMTIASIKQISQPATWKTGNDRAGLQGPGKEGTPVQVVGFLKKAKPESAESCNCGLATKKNTDVHVVMVEASPDPEDSSITAEVTPRIRAAGHPKWTAERLQALEGKLVRLTGWLMLDTAHLPHPVLLPNERKHEPLKRSTNWEVHPITKIERCTGNEQKCMQGQGWMTFD